MAECSSKNDVKNPEAANVSGITIIEDRPIMQLFKRLINYTSMNLTLTNKQIIQILHKDFDIHTGTLHSLTVDVYVNIIKKYLREWPEWDEFDQITNLQAEKSPEYVKKILERKYENIKLYLGEMLEIAKPLANEAVKEVQKVTKDSNKMNEVMMEVSCSRDQLNQLIHRNPQAENSTDIFNLTENIHNRIILHMWDLESILKLQVQININLPCISFVREMKHVLKHVLVNKMHTKHVYNKEALNTSLMVRSNSAKRNLNKAFINRLLTDLMMFYKDHPGYSLYKTIFELMRNELDLIPLPIVNSCSFSKILNQYAYVRYLYTDEWVSDDNKYDLQIEETLVPRIQISYNKYGFFEHKNMPTKDWLKLRCGYCEVLFTGQSIEDTIVEHYNIYHQNEPDWFCTNCKQRFNVKQLAENMWYHDC